MAARWRSRKGDCAPAGAILRSKREPGQWRQICICNYLYALASLDLKLLLRDLLIAELGIVYTRRFLTTPLNEFAEMCDLEFGLTPYIRQNPLTHY